MGTMAKIRTALFRNPTLNTVVCRRTTSVRTATFRSKMHAMAAMVQFHRTKANTEVFQRRLKMAQVEELTELCLLEVLTIITTRTDMAKCRPTIRSATM